MYNNYNGSGFNPQNPDNHENAPRDVFSEERNNSFGDSQNRPANAGQYGQGQWQYGQGQPSQQGQQWQYGQYGQFGQYGQEQPPQSQNSSYMPYQSYQPYQPYQPYRSNQPQAQQAQQGGFEQNGLGVPGQQPCQTPQTPPASNSYGSFRPYTSYQPSPAPMPSQYSQIPTQSEFTVTYPERKAIKSQYFGVFAKGIIHAVGSFALAQIIFIAMTLSGYQFGVNEDGAQIMDWKYLLAGTIPSVAFCLLLFLWDKIKGKISFKSYFSTEKISGRSVLGFFGAFLFAFSAGQISQYILYIGCLFFGVSPISQSYATVPQYDTPYFIVTFLMTVFIGPIAEELMFRGVILRGFSHISGRFAIFMSAAMFGLMHGNLTQSFCAFVMGIVFGYAAVKTDSLVLPVLGHITANFVTATTSLVEYFIDEDVSNSYWFAILGLFGLIGLAAVIALYSKGHIRFPEYSEYHRKRTMPIVITCVSFWILMIIYWGDILSKFEFIEF